MQANPIFFLIKNKYLNLKLFLRNKKKNIKKEIVLFLLKKNFHLFNYEMQ